MTENEAIERIKEQACNDRFLAIHCDDSCMYGDGKCEWAKAIQVLEEIQQYRSIGTVEEFKALKEKNEPKKPKQSGVHDANGEFHAINGINGVPYDLCPCCGINLCTDGFFGNDKKELNYCKKCGQALKWSEGE